MKIFSKYSPFSVKLFPFVFFLLINSLFIIRTFTIDFSFKQWIFAVWPIVCWFIEFLLLYFIYSLFIKKYYGVSDEVLMFKGKKRNWTEIKDIALIVGNKYKLHAMTFEGVPALWFSNGEIIQTKLKTLPDKTEDWVFNISNKEFANELEKVMLSKKIELKIVNLESAI